jgi:hypothetical protein
LVGLTLVDVWVAIIEAGTLDESVLGIYATEELALTTANRVSPEAAEARHYVLDAIPDWVDDF